MAATPRSALGLSDNWSIVTSGYVGGLGIGTASQLVWNWLIGVNWSLNDWFGLHFGYRILDYDFVRGSGADLFEYDMRMAGPYLAMSFSF